MLELLITHLSWPVTVLILGLVAIRVFKQPISRLLDRTQKVTRSGLETGGAVQDGSTTSRPSPADELLKLFDNVLLVQRESLLREHLDKSGVTQGPDREKVLVRLLAASSIFQVFERAHFLIWGSQIAVLQLLNSASVDGVSLEQIRPTYDEASRRDPERYANYSFEQWLGFLQSFALITRIGDRVTINLDGREFLKHLVHQGYSLSRAG